MRTVALSHLEFRILWESYDGKSSLMLVRIQQRIELVKKTFSIVINSERRKENNKMKNINTNQIMILIIASHSNKYRIQ